MDTSVSRARSPEAVPPPTATAEHYCTACGRALSGFGAGPGGRPNVSCPHCGSFERHRYLACLLDVLRPTVPLHPRILEVAPSPQTTPLLERMAPRQLVSVDFDPAADGRRVDVQASLTDLPFADGSVDLLLCLHVLEHIPDDRAAMAEIARVLSAVGVAVVQVPWRESKRTDEDPAASPQERIERFGRVDHVRYYGGDFEERLVEAGCSVTQLRAGSLLGAALCGWAGITEQDTMWLLRPSHATRAELTVLPRGAVASAVDALVDAGAERRAQEHLDLARRQRRRVRRLRADKRRLEQQLARRNRSLTVEIRLPARLARQVRRLRP